MEGGEREREGIKNKTELEREMGSAIRVRERDGERYQGRMKSDERESQ